MQIFQEFRNKYTYHEIIAYSLLLSVFFWIFITLELWAFKNSKLRTFALVMCTLPLLSFFHSLNDLYNRLTTAQDTDSIKRIISKEKLFAECASAISLLSLFVGIITFSVDDDKKNTQGKFNSYIPIHNLVTFVGSDENCNSINEIFNKISCQKITQQSNEILNDIFTKKNELELNEKILDLKQNLKAASTNSPREIQKRVTSILNQLEDFEISDIWYDSIKFIALFFTILCAPIALAKKIAIARYDCKITGSPRHPPSSIDK